MKLVGNVIGQTNSIEAFNKSGPKGCDEVPRKISHEADSVEQEESKPRGSNASASNGGGRRKTSRVVGNIESSEHPRGGHHPRTSRKSTDQTSLPYNQKAKTMINHFTDWSGMNGHIPAFV